MSDAIRLEIQKRKEPRQGRSKATVEAILEATARILVSEGLDRLSTNRVAKVAGVSVGSLYQYFTNKEALLVALCERHFAEMMEFLQSCLRDFVDAPIEDAVRAYVRGMFEVHAVAPELHHELMQAQKAHEALVADEIEGRMFAAVRMFLEMHKDTIVPKDLDLAAFILIRSVEAVTHAGLISILVEPDLKKRGAEMAALESEVGDLILRYLGVVENVT